MRGAQLDDLILDPDHAKCTFRDFLSSLVSETAADTHRELLSIYISGMATWGPNPIRMAAAYLIAMISELNLWLEKLANLTMLEVIVAEEVFAREAAAVASGTPLPSESSHCSTHRTFSRPSPGAGGSACAR